VTRQIGIALVLAAACGAAPALAADPPPPAPPPGAPPPAAATPPAPASPPPPEWAPPADQKGGEGNLRGAPLLAPTGEPRHFTLTWNPFTLFAVRAQLMLEAMLTDHHVISLSLYYGGTRTNEVYSPSCMAMDSAHSCANTTLFQGFGGEIGYRWYSGTAGPRGFYIGPSFLLGRFEATPTVGAGTSAQMNGTSTPFWNIGGAIDAGWQALIADRFVAGLGGGLEYTVPTQSFPTQDLPASVYANRGLHPRILLGLGVAFD